MKKNIFKPDDWNSMIVAIAIVAIIFAGTFTVKHYQGRKEARKKIENCKFKLRDNEGARRTYMATAPEINDSIANARIAEFDSTQNQLLREIQRYQKKLK
jgi:hypothetical protein